MNFGFFFSRIGLANEIFDRNCFVEIIVVLQIRLKPTPQKHSHGVILSSTKCQKKKSKFIILIEKFRQS